MRRATIALFALALGGCGLEQPLQPPQGSQMPPAPAMAARAPTVDEMLTAPPIARPERIDELLRRSEEREDDRFALPPPDRTTEVVNDVGDQPQ
jgi:hypothetical protein